MRELRIVTTSWDDGYLKDLKVAKLLRSRGLAGTFYIPIQGVNGKEVLDDAAIRNLANQGFEIGGHGYSHRNLTDLSSDELHQDVTLSVQTLEQILGRSVHMFCCPNGRINKNVIRALKEAGLEGCRTTRMLHTNLDFRSFEMPVTLQAYPHPARAYFKNLAKEQHFHALWRYMPRVCSSASWIEVGRMLFDAVMREGGVWHLYGHSWEIEELGLWAALEEMLDYVSNCQEVLYLSNHALLNLKSPPLQQNSSQSIAQCKS
ncbi:MAG TPA: polysaccharide deacetylase family protein [Terriglobia bacterium]|nr:polysaccharide deacetylase family protein [Terriglobia bacterium]